MFLIFAGKMKQIILADKRPPKKKDAKTGNLGALTILMFSNAEKRIGNFTELNIRLSIKFLSP